MNSPSVTVFLFVKGTATSSIENMVAQAQLAASLDTLEKLRYIPEVGRLVVSTANADFAARAAALGAQVELDSPVEDFHFGKRLAALVKAHDAAIPLYVGGGSGALMREDDWSGLARRIVDAQDTVISNNYFSCDFAGWSPGRALATFEPPDLDNDLAFRLGERAGLRVSPLPKNAATQLDIDTPTDLLTISFHPDVGPNLRAFLAAQRLDTGQAERMKSLLHSRTATVLIAGRISASMGLFLERDTLCQWRILSEERGMRASGRQARGEVRSILGYLLERSGAGNFFSTLAHLADGAVIDTRVLFAHHGLRPPAQDRFHSDLLEPQQIEDSFIREFTAAARASGLPVLLGGHSLVSGGMYALAEG